MERYIFLRNVTDLFSDGKTTYERRFGQPFKGPIIPFGSLVEYHPLTATDQSRIHQCEKKVFTWIVPRIRFGRGRNLRNIVAHQNTASVSISFTVTFLMIMRMKFGTTLQHVVSTL